MSKLNVETKQLKEYDMRRKDPSSLKCSGCDVLLTDNNGIQYMLFCRKNPEILLCKACAFDMAMGLLRDCDCFNDHNEYHNFKNEWEKNRFNKDTPLIEEDVNIK